MKYDKYLELVVQSIPHLKNIEKIPFLTKPEAVKMVALELYLTPLDENRVYTTALIDIETRKQLHSLREHGVHCFD
jgi:hypothetical protein